MGRIFWTLRRTSLYALVALLFCVFNEISFKSIVSKAFPFSGTFDLFYTSMVWSGPALLAFFSLSLVYAKCFFKESYSRNTGIGTFVFEDLVSPIYNIYFFFACIKYARRGDSVAWDGVVFDLVWTIFWISYLVIHVRAIL